MARLDAAPVCVVTLTYVAELDAVDAHMKRHVAWLKDALDEGVLLLAGRQVPRTGGVLVVRGRRAEVEAWAASDPFVVEGVAEAAVVEMAASFCADALADTFE